MSEEHYAYLLVEDEKWWNLRCSRNRTGNTVHAFVRRGKVGPKWAQKILFYVKSPVKQIRGFAGFLERITGTRDELWNQYGSETVFESRDQYDSFVGNRSNVTFIRFKDLEEFEKPISFDVIRTVTGGRQVFQGGKYLKREAVNSIIKGEL